MRVRQNNFLCRYKQRSLTCCKILKVENCHSSNPIYTLILRTLSLVVLRWPTFSPTSNIPRWCGNPNIDNKGVLQHRLRCLHLNLKLQYSLHGLSRLHGIAWNTFRSIFNFFFPIIYYARYTNYAQRRWCPVLRIYIGYIRIYKLWVIFKW